MNDINTWLQQMEMLQKQIDAIQSIMVESWKNIEAFFCENASIIESIMRRMEYYPRTK